MSESATSHSRAANVARKHYIPLESSPDVFTPLIHNIGVPSLSFYDILSVDESDENELLNGIPRPALALILVFPTTETYEKDIVEAEANREVYTASGESEDVVWFKQTIGNACGLYGILHALCNGEARKHIGRFCDDF